MGREVASAYRRRKYTYPPASASAAAHPRPSPPHNSSMESLSDPPDNLTPARKHHKLLKDGSEVWSKEVEKIFVDGLPPSSPFRPPPRSPAFLFPSQVFACTGSPLGLPIRAVAADGATSISLTTLRNLA